MDNFSIKNIGHLIVRELSTLSDPSNDLKDTLEGIIYKVLKTIGGNKGSLYLIDRITGENVRILSNHKKQEDYTEDRITIDEELKVMVVDEGKSYIPILKESPGRIVYIPIVMMGNTIGILKANKVEENGPFLPKEVNRLEFMAKNIAHVVDNIRLNNEKERSLGQLSDLMKISRILNSSLDPREVHEKTIEAIMKLMDCEVGSLLLVDADTEELFFEVALGEKGDKVKEIRLKIGEGIAGWVARENKPILTNDVKSDQRHSQRADDRSKFFTRNMVCVPAVIDDNVIGVLQAINKLDGKKFTQEDLVILVSLSHQVAIAIDNARLHVELKETFYQTIEALANAIEKRDPYTGNHTKRVMSYSLALAHYLELTDEEMEYLKLAAILHDVGKIGVEDSILRKDTILDDREFDEIKKHPEFGEDILKEIKMLKKVIPGIKHHHERVDGEGYPDGLSTDYIPKIAKIIAVTDTFDAITTDRPYRKALSDEKAIEELRIHTGAQFDREIVEAFIRSYEDGKIKGRK